MAKYHHFPTIGRGVMDVTIALTLRIAGHAAGT
jgi:hypothetical protein